MHRDFADWYRLASVEPSEEQLQKRWQGVETCITNVDKDLAAAMVQLYFDQSPASEEVVRFQQSFKEADETFPLTGNMQELQVLAGSALAVLLEGKGSKLNDFVALCIGCAAFGVSRLPEAVPVLPRLGESNLHERSLTVRKTQDRIVVQSPKAEADVEGADFPTLAQSVASALDKGQAAAKASTQKALDTVTRSQRVFQEELDALWWVVGNYSGDLRKPFSEVKSAALPLVAAKELADHTLFIPGFLAADALLSKVVQHGSGKSKSVTLKQAVDQSARTWRVRVRKEIVSPELLGFCPCLLAVTKSLDTDDSESWVPVYEKVGRLGLEKAHDRTALARQFYDEIMLTRAAKAI